MKYWALIMVSKGKTVLNQRFLISYLYIPLTLLSFLNRVFQECKYDMTKIAFFRLYMKECQEVV